MKLKPIYLPELKDIPQSTYETPSTGTVKFKLTFVSGFSSYLELTREGALELIERIKEQLK